jgi:serine/threonine protein kinase
MTETLLAHDLQLRDRIGSGGFGSVYTAWHAGYQQILAVKISDLRDVNWSCELESLKTLYHVNIVKLYDTFADDSFQYLVLEYCAGGTLAERIAQQGPLSFREFREIAKQLLDALACCHGAGIAHLDIKPANIFFHSDGRVRLGDFGCSRTAGGNFLGGSMPFMSPEMICAVEHLNKFRSDIWSLGITFYMMATGRLPWRGADTEAIKAEIRLGVGPHLSGIDTRIAPLIKSAMQFEPSRRASLESLIETVAGWSSGTGTPLKGVFAATTIRRSRTHLLPQLSRSSFSNLEDLAAEVDQSFLSGNPDE